MDATQKYSSDLPAVSWQVIEKIIQVRRRSKWELREIVNAVLYVTKNGCVWRDLPGDFPVWQTVYYYYASWSAVARPRTCKRGGPLDL